MFSHIQAEYLHPAPGESAPAAEAEALPPAEVAEAPLPPAPEADRPGTGHGMSSSPSTGSEFHTPPPRTQAASFRALWYITVVPVVWSNTWCMNLGAPLEPCSTEKLPHCRQDGMATKSDDCVKKLEVDQVFDPEVELQSLLLEQEMLEEMLAQEEMERELAMLTREMKTLKISSEADLVEKERSLLNSTVSASSNLAPSVLAMYDTFSVFRLTWTVKII